MGNGHTTLRRRRDVSSYHIPQPKHNNAPAPPCDAQVNEERSGSVLPQNLDSTISDSRDLACQCAEAHRRELSLLQELQIAKKCFDIELNSEIAKIVRRQINYEFLQAEFNARVAYIRMLEERVEYKI
ncbi:hypothetical protein ERJ75_001733200 [Trypanosoma vivax]|uniref:Uncharacterized protein n=1 Tax=Trypanosoma vivax (strain Y486) TaxID=1055687 RepID=G0U347_TRYVY|nr:hypothetical protein TRVL_05202 [Trypanosoma vivax]KAH8604210.1 hypothetical protein ERJ75_001733200 [Trypanosoma vivax]CCC50702.1 hypothetical protein TVY486_0905230 [Trypanosoma vivax Y486]